MSGEGTDLSPPPSRPTRGVVRARFEDKQDKTLDDAMGRGETWAKKVRNSQQGILLDDVPTLLAVLGLKVVDADRVRAKLDHVQVARRMPELEAGHRVRVVLGETRPSPRGRPCRVWRRT